MLRFLWITRFLSCIPLLLLVGQLKAQIYKDRDLILPYDQDRKIAPREKLYVQLDKEVFAPQDTLWFKAYLVDATLHSYSTTSGLIYFDLINESGLPVATLAMPSAFGLSWGSFALKEQLFVPGVYTFRAYTKWMQNFGDTYIFKQTIRILDVETPGEPSATAKSTTRTSSETKMKAGRSTPGIDIQFLPEGGTWLSNRHQRIAFKAINSAGKGVIVSGHILNSKKQAVADFQTNNNGMGSLAFTPLPGELYTAQVKMGNTYLEQKLPAPLLSGTALHVDPNLEKDSILVTVSTRLAATQTLRILAQSRGVLCFMATIRAESDEKTLKIPKSVLVTGVAQILLTNQTGDVLNERCFFLNFHDQLTISSSLSSPSYGKRDSIPVKIKVLDASGKPVEGSFSMAVTDDKQVTKQEDQSQNILTYLLLSSDLKGEIERPAQYFAEQNEHATEDLDLLMLTQGWVSYDWPKNQKIAFTPEKDYTISGRVRNVMNKPIENAKVTLIGQNKGFLLLDTIANQQGEFVFDHLPVLDSATVVIQSLNTKGKKGTLGIEVDEFSRPPLMLRPASFTDESIGATDSTTQGFIAAKKRTEEALIKSGVMLRQVEITGKKTIKGSKNLNGPGVYTQALNEKNLAPLAKKTLYDVLLKEIKGFRTGPNRKGDLDFFINFDTARFVFDGIALDTFYDGLAFGPNAYYQFVKSYLDYYTAEDVIGIETMENGLSWRYKNWFKPRLDNGPCAYIEITTKTSTGPFLKKAANMYLLKLVNYGDRKTFYQPKYTAAHKNSAIPDYRSTLYWNPNLVTDQNGMAEIYFYSSDQKGTYTIWIEGTDTQGAFGMHTVKVEIK